MKEILNNLIDNNDTSFMNKIKGSSEKERKERVDELNRIARKPENIKKMVDFLKITGQIPGITPKEEGEYWDKARKEELAKISTKERQVHQEVKRSFTNKGYYLVIILILVILAYYFYFGIIKCQHNFWLDWMGEIIGISCYP